MKQQKQIAKENGNSTSQTMEHYLPNDLLAEYEKAFKILDRKKVGKISLRDLSTVACSIGFRLSDRELSDVIKHVVEVPKSALSRCLDFRHFLAAMAAIITDCISDDEIRRIFREFDKDGDGFISPQELRALLLRLGDDVTESEIQEMITEADTDGDGRVSLNEFIQVMTSSVDQNQVNCDVTINISTSTESVSSSASNASPRDVINRNSDDGDDLPRSRLNDVTAFPTRDVIAPPKSPGSLSLPTPRKLLGGDGEFGAKTPQTKRKSSVLGWLKKTRKNKSCDHGVTSASCHDVYSVAHTSQKRERRWKSLGIIPGFSFKSI